jgi:hypothetical protein
MTEQIEQIAHLRTLLAAATPGPWEWCHEFSVAGDVVNEDMAYLMARSVDEEVTDWIKVENAALIAEGLAVLPALLDVAEAAPSQHYRHPISSWICVCGREWPCKLGSALDALASANPQKCGYEIADHFTEEQFKDVRLAD